MQKRNGGKKIKILGGEVIKGGRGEGGTYTNTMGDQIGLREDKREQQLCEACKREIKGRKEHYLSNCAKNRFAVSRYIKSKKKKKSSTWLSHRQWELRSSWLPRPQQIQPTFVQLLFPTRNTCCSVCAVSFFRLLCFKERSRISFIVFQRSISHPVWAHLRSLAMIQITWPPNSGRIKHKALNI